MVGNWNNSEYGKNIRSKYSVFDNLILLDPIYNQRKLDLLRGNAYLYVHGHSAGGTNPSLVEAMYFGLPIITFDVSYNRTTTENKAYYFKNADDILKIIEGTRLPEFKQLGDKMKEIANRRYTWNVVAEKYNNLIIGVLANNKKLSVKPTVSDFNDLNYVEFELGHLQNTSLFFERR